MSDFATCDICDKFDEVQVLQPNLLQNYGGVSKFEGKIFTIKLFEDNAPIRETVEAAGENRVMVVDGGGSLRASLLGGNLAAKAAKNGWAGLVVYGCVRDIEELKKANLGILAVGLMPRKTERNLHSAKVGGKISFGGVVFNNEDYLYADVDGVVVSKEKL